MRVIYLECGMGAAGDMLTAALLELCGEPDKALRLLNNTGLPGVTYTAESCVKHGIRGTRLRVTVNGHEEGAETAGHETEHSEHHAAHASRSLGEVLSVIDSLRLSETVREHAKAVYALVAEAEGRVHGTSASEVHFHEVGSLDAMADIVGFCLLMECLRPERVLSSPIATGFGEVQCAHGWLPVPAPATAVLLEGIPIYSGDVRGELCTPTGAALIKHFVQEYGSMPAMAVRNVGYGMGTKDFDRVNGVRVFFGDAVHFQAASHPADTVHVASSGLVGFCESCSCESKYSHQPMHPDETITELACNLDDMTPEALAFAQEMLMDAGALDAYVTPIVMKKGRAGFQLTCLCETEQVNRFAALIFTHTTTLGLRVNETARFTLHRALHTVETPYGTARIKTAEGFGVVKAKPEYEDAASIARANGLSFTEADAAIRTAYSSES